MIDPRDPRTTNPYAAPSVSAPVARRPAWLAPFCLLLGVYRLATFGTGIALHHAGGEVGKRLVVGVLWVAAGIGLLRLRPYGRWAAVAAAVVTVGHNLYVTVRSGDYSFTVTSALIVALFNVPPIVIACYVLSRRYRDLEKARG